jgi:import inner membrane translocase subunit TIM23
MEGDKIYLNQRKQENLYIESYSGNDWGEKLSFTVGLSYLAGIAILIKVASSIGLVRGTIEGFPRKFNMPRKLILNNFFNSVGKQTSQFGQAAASASNLL